MAITTTFAIDSAAISATFAVAIAGTPITTYSYANVQYTLAERLLPAVITLADAVTYLQGARAWFNLVQRYLSPPSNGVTPCRERYARKTLGVRAQFYTLNGDDDGVVLIDGTYAKATGLITYAPRPLYVCNVRMFDWFLRCVERLQTDAASY